MTNVTTDMQTHICEYLYMYILYITFENKIKKILSNSIKKVKYLQINLTKCYEIFIVKTMKTILREVIENQNKWKHIQCLRIRGQHVIMSVLSKFIYRCSANPNQIPAGY